ncbi:MAG: hypothetical protein IJX18_01620, partial [Clostridia bacterium]|nr:hypothetical protein [Clostridia bacterium]
GIGSTFFVALFKKRKDEKLLLRLGEEKEKRRLLYHLALLSSKECLLFIYPNSQPKHEADVWWVEQADLLIFPLFLWTELQTHDVLPVLKVCLREKKKGILLCNEIATDAAALAAQFDVDCQQGEVLYKRLKEENALPTAYLSEPYFTKKKKRLPRIWFAKSNSRRFFVCGTLLLLSSLLVPFPIYYLCFGGLLLIAAVLIRVLGYR